MNDKRCSCGLTDEVYGTHFDDCSCSGTIDEKRIAQLEQELAEARKQLSESVTPCQSIRIQEENHNAYLDMMTQRDSARQVLADMKAACESEKCLDLIEARQALAEYEKERGRLWIVLAKCGRFPCTQCKDAHELIEEILSTPAPTQEQGGEGR